MKKLFLIPLLLISLINFAQNYAPKDHYLIDSLVLESLSQYDRDILDTALILFHEAKDDTSKIQALLHITEGLNNDIWQKYNALQLKITMNALKKNNDTKSELELKKALANTYGNIGFINKKQWEYRYCSSIP